MEFNDIGERTVYETVINCAPAWVVAVIIAVLPVVNKLVDTPVLTFLEQTSNLRLQVPVDPPV